MHTTYSTLHCIMYTIERCWSFMISWKCLFEEFVSFIFMWFTHSWLVHEWILHRKSCHVKSYKRRQVNLRLIVAEGAWLVTSSRKAYNFDGQKTKVAYVGRFVLCLREEENWWLHNEWFNMLTKHVKTNMLKYLKCTRSVGAIIENVRMWEEELRLISIS